MSLFFQPLLGSNADARDDAERETVTCSAWSGRSAAEPLLAIAKQGSGGVYVYNARGVLQVGNGSGNTKRNGNTLANGSSDSDEKTFSHPRNCAATVMEWHPTQLSLAVGWKDGSVAIWSHKDCSLQEDSTQHQSELGCLKWSP